MIKFVIIINFSNHFLKSKVKNSQQWYFAWESLRWGFYVVVIVVVYFWCISSYIDVLHFVVVSSFNFQATLLCHRHSTLVSQDSEGLHQLWVLPRLLLIGFSFSSTPGATDLSGRFLPTGVFYLTLLPNIFGTTWFYQGFPGSQQLFLEICRASCWSSKNTDQGHLFVWFTLIHNPLQILNLYLYMSILEKFLVFSAATLFSSHENIKQQPN